MSLKMKRMMILFCFVEKYFVGVVFNTTPDFNLFLRPKLNFCRSSIQCYALKFSHYYKFPRPKMKKSKKRFLIERFF